MNNSITVIDDGLSYIDAMIMHFLTRYGHQLDTTPSNDKTIYNEQKYLGYSKLTKCKNEGPFDGDVLNIIPLRGVIRNTIN